MDHLLSSLVEDEGGLYLASVPSRSLSRLARSKHAVLQWVTSAARPSRVGGVGGAWGSAGCWASPG